MVENRTFKIQRNPDHTKLSDYVSDNLTSPCPLVGLEYITEFVKETGDGRPFYYCSLKACCYEQGDSRQMFQHLVSFHHVLTWIQVFILFVCIEIVHNNN